MKVDRDLQWRILECAREKYPGRITPKSVLNEGLEVDSHTLTRQLHYLEEHGVIETLKAHSLDRPFATVIDFKITCRGIDLLADDGGLSAILGVVKIKFHQESLKDSIAGWIKEESMPQPEKHRWISALGSLSSSGTKYLVRKLIDMGLTHSPDVWHVLERHLGMGP